MESGATLVDRAELDALSPDELESKLDELEAARRRVTALEAALVGEADRRQMATADGCRTLSEWVAGRLDVDEAEARRLVTLGRRLGDLPRTATELADGEIGAARAELVCRVADAASEE